MCIALLLRGSAQKGKLRPGVFTIDIPNKKLSKPQIGYLSIDKPDGYLNDE